MKNKYLIATLLALLASEVPAQKLLVNITIDGLNADKMIAVGQKPTSTGFRKLIRQALLYKNATYPFTPVDRASAMAAIVTGTTPFYNGITGNRWLDKQTLRPIGCVADGTPKAMLCSNLADELKVKTEGAGMVFSIANDQEAAILSAGHAANGAFFRDSKTKRWCTSSYYSKTGFNWLSAFDSLNPAEDNHTITKLAFQCIDSNLLGTDEMCDILSVNYDADHYESLDRCLGNLIQGVEQKVGAQNVLFTITGTINTDETFSDAYERFKVPSGTFYINRTGNLLNMYLGALYGRHQYIEGYYRNHIFFNKKIIEQRRLNKVELRNQCRSFLLDCDGVKDVKTTADVLPPHSGDLIVEIMPGWNLLNEESGEKYQYRANFMPVPIIIYGEGIKPQHIDTEVTIDRLAPTIANCIHIRAPNASTAQPLF